VWRPLFVVVVRGSFVFLRPFVVLRVRVAFVVWGSFVFVVVKWRSSFVFTEDILVICIVLVVCVVALFVVVENRWVMRGHRHLRSWNRGDVVAILGAKYKAVSLSIVLEEGGLVVVDWVVVNGGVEYVGGRGICGGT
jgi:hypothetical protein